MQTSICCKWIGRRFVWIPVLSCGLACSREDQGRATPHKYEIKVGERAYDLSLDKPVQVATPKGEQVTLVLHRKKVIAYNRHGLSFEYPSDLELEEKEAEGISMIMLDHRDSPLAVIQVLPSDTDEAKWRRETLDGTNGEYKKMGLKPKHEPGETCKQRIMEAERSGKRMVWPQADFSFVNETYFVPVGSKHIGIMLQYTDDETKLAFEKFKVVLESLRWDEGKKNK